MLRRLIIASATGIVTDPNMRAGLHFDGSDGSTSMVDVKAHTWTEGASGCVLDTGQSKFGGSSLEGVSANSYIESTSSDYTPGTGDWTVEFFHRPTIVSSARGLFDMRPTGTDGLYLTIYHSAADLIFFTNSAARITATSALTVNTWKHIAVCKASGTTRMFLDGTQVGSSYTDANNYIGTRITVANFGTSRTGGVVGNIDDLRYSSIARYTSNFTAPTAAFSDT